ncbi:hypothetical protein HNP99_001138 [Flavobacterium sp. 28A]|uniref:hypothetical protein n=1 Tax=Flavobacterium sp. 28A TaxID=2735895 RepID=UPI00156FB2DC|nr:hypothetical protein [Flavobacterium sp. 28A]NRT14794.1 hypothetical protein [Flavobacterium sp. 28A]
MIQIEIMNNDNFREKSWELEKEIDNQIILSLNEDVEHFHAMRFPKKKLIWVTNLKEKEINYLIELCPLKHNEPGRNLCNKTSFFFGGDDNSLYQFSNINIKGIIKEAFQFVSGTEKQVFRNEKSHRDQEIIEICEIEKLPCSELLFMQVSHHSKLIFFNCVFYNSSELDFIIETWNDAVIEFVNCEFKGNFSFNSNQDSVIIRH